MLRSYFRTVPVARKFKYIHEQFSEFKSNRYRLLVQRLNAFSKPLVLDVGANVGQFATDLFSYGYSGKLISIEPSRSSFEKLVFNCRKYPSWQGHNIAFGDKNGSQTLNISANNGLSSSILDMNEVHATEFPESQIIGKEEILVQTLDNFLKTNSDLGEVSLLKMDVQGFEKNVILGAQDNISKVRHCLIEVSLLELYKNEASLLEIISLLDSNNHRVIDIHRGIKSKSGELLQIDILTKQKIPN